MFSSGESTLASMEDTHPCPRCGRSVRWRGVGRPPRWCSAECRRRGHEDNIRVHEVVRERVVELHVPHNPITAVDVVLGDVDAVRELLHRLTDQVRAVPRTELERANRRRLLMLSREVDQLTIAMREITTEEMPALAARRAEWKTVPELLGEPAPEPPPQQSPPPQASARGRGQKNGKGQKKQRHGRR